MSPTPPASAPRTTWPRFSRNASASPRSNTARNCAPWHEPAPAGSDSPGPRSGRGQPREVAIDLQALGLAFLRVKLGGEHPAASDGGGELALVVAGGQHELRIGRHTVVAVHEVERLSLVAQAVLQRGAGTGEAHGVPAHVGNLAAGRTLETHDLARENAETGDVAF